MKHHWHAASRGSGREPGGNRPQEFEICSRLEGSDRRLFERWRHGHLLFVAGITAWREAAHLRAEGDGELFSRSDDAGFRPLNGGRRLRCAGISDLF